MNRLALSIVSLVALAIGSAFNVSWVAAQDAIPTEIEPEPLVQRSIPAPMPMDFYVRPSQYQAILAIEEEERAMAHPQLGPNGRRPVVRVLGKSPLVLGQRVLFGAPPEGGRGGYYGGAYYRPYGYYANRPF